MSPILEARNAWLPSPEMCPWVEEIVEECAAFPAGAHDDDCDALSQAWNRLLVQPIYRGEVFTEEDLDDELAGFQIAPY